MLVGYSMLTAVQPWLPARTSLGVTRVNSNSVDLFDTWQQQQPLVGSNFNYNSITNSNSHLSSNNKPKSPPLSTIIFPSPSPSPSLSSPSPSLLSSSSPPPPPLSFSSKTDSAILAVSQSQQLTPLPIPPKSVFPLPFCFAWLRENKSDPGTNRVQKVPNGNAETTKTSALSKPEIESLLQLTETSSHVNISGDSSMDQLLAWKPQSLTNTGAEELDEEKGEEEGKEEEGEEEDEVFEEAFMTYEGNFDGGFYDEDFNLESESDLKKVTTALEAIRNSSVSVTENGTEEGKSGTESRTWSAHMQGFHSLWRGLRAHIRAAGRRQEGGENGREEVSKEVGGGEEKKRENEEKSKPLKTSVWAMAALLDWRREESEKQKQQYEGPIVMEGESRREREGKEENWKMGEGEGVRVATGNLKGAKGLSIKCRECELGECEIREAEGENFPEKVKPGMREVERVRVAHTKETMQDFLSHSSTMELRTVSLMSTLCDLAYMIPQIKAADLYRLHRLHFVTSSLAVKAETAAKEKEKLVSQTSSKPSLSDGSDSQNMKGKKGEEGGVSPSTAYSFAAAAASFLQTQSMAFLPMGTSNEKQKTSELLGIEGEEKFGSGSLNVLPSPALAMQTMEKVEGMAEEGRVRGGGEESVSCILKEGNSARGTIEEGEGREISEMGFKGDGKANGKEESPVNLEKNKVQDSSSSTSDVVNWIELSEGAEREAEEIVRARESEEREKREKTIVRASEEEEGEKRKQRETTFATAAVMAVESEKGRVGGTPVSCPCEWFICDKLDTHSRYVVIQGSDSLASWHTNISFDPIIFEDESLGVMVHRGIYEAAQALYDTLLPYIKKFVEKHGADKAKIFLTGHSLGGSLATLLNLMLHIRGGIPKSCLEPVFTFGAPSIMCGGDHLLDLLKLPHSYVKQVIMARDLVPRAFSCDYPDHVAEVLRRMSSSFRDHPCLLHQRLMYAPMGTMIVLQPDERQAPPHPLLPDGAGLYLLRHPQQNDAGLPHQRTKCRVEVRAAQRAVLNNPHPLEILADPGSYGSEGAISRDHDPRNYTKAVNGIIRQEARRLRKLQREQRRQMWWPLVAAEGVPSNGQTPPVTLRGKAVGVREGPVASRVGSYGRRRRGLRQVAAGGGTANGIMSLGGGGGAFSANGATPGGDEREIRCRSLIASQHVQMGLLALATTASLFGSGSSSELISLV